MGTPKKESQIKLELVALINMLGWSRNQAARYIYTETHDFDDDSEIRKFEANFIKALQRDQNQDRLEVYFDILLASPEAEAIDFVKNKYIPLDVISSSLSESMKDISKCITKTLKSE